MREARGLDTASLGMVEMTPAQSEALGRRGSSLGKVENPAVGQGEGLHKVGLFGY